MSPWFSSERWSCESCVLIKNKPNPSIHQPVKLLNHPRNWTEALLRSSSQDEHKRKRRNSGNPLAVSHILRQSAKETPVLSICSNTVPISLVFIEARKYLHQHRHRKVNLRSCHSMDWLKKSGARTKCVGNGRNVYKCPQALYDRCRVAGSQMMVKKTTLR